MPAPDLVCVQWRKSSYSGNNGNCVEVADMPGGVAVRDSKSPSGAMLIVNASTWDKFLAGVRRGPRAR